MGRSRLAIRELKVARLSQDWLKTVTVNVSSGQASGSSSADSELVGGCILGIYSSGNQDQYVDNVALNSDGSITVTLGANATAINNFKVVVMKKPTLGTQ